MVKNYEKELRWLEWKRPFRCLVWEGVFPIVVREVDLITDRWIFVDGELIEELSGKFTDMVFYCLDFKVISDGSVTYESGCIS